MHDSLRALLDATALRLTLGKASRCLKHQAPPFPMHLMRGTPRHAATRPVLLHRQAALGTAGQQQDQPTEVVRHSLLLGTACLLAQLQQSRAAHHGAYQIPNSAGEAGCSKECCQPQDTF